MAAQQDLRDAGRYADVAVDAQVGPERAFTYEIPPGITLVPGHVVWVPLLSRRVAGVVVSLSDTTNIGGVRPVLGLQDPSPALSAQQLSLMWWLSRETRCSLFEAAALMLPQDYRRRLVCRVALVDDAASPPGGERAPSEREVRLRDYLSRRGPSPVEPLLRALGERTRQTIRRMVRAGQVTEEWQWARPVARPVYAETLRLAVGVDDARDALDALSRAPRQRALLEQLLEEETLNGAQARKEYGPGAVKGLVTRKLAEVERRRRVRDPLARQSQSAAAPALTLTAEQESAVARIAAGVRAGRGESFLLHGPTGSGKTEVYLRALEACIATGKRGMLLAPEISLTPQLVSALQGRFPGRVGLLHSGLSAGQHYDTWWRMRQGDFDVVLGTRSALFAPMPDVGLIILDEEHEWTYKQADHAPRYHARETALAMGQLTGAVVALGSATPDVASFFDALAGRHALLTLRERLRPDVDGAAMSAPLAGVEVVDMREELKAGVRSIFSRALSGALTETLEQGRQAILFLNRRGTAGTVQCRSCGHVLVCRSCASPLNLHGDVDRLVCHQCGRRSRTGGSCPRCRSPHIRYLGLGTQRVVQEVERTTGAAVLRWDRDAAREREAHEEIMRRFVQGEAQVLVGTQMVAQGLHLPNVTLVGVVLADLGLYLPDFRAGERAFQLLCQVSGRAGRGADPGRVVVQTYSPEHYAVQAGARQDYRAFYDVEVDVRREQRNPPYSRLARWVFQHTNMVYAERASREFGAQLRAALAEEGLTEAEVAGPAPAYPSRVRGRYRWHVTLRLPPTPAVEMPDLLSTLPSPPGWTVDVDPVSLV